MIKETISPVYKTEGTELRLFLYDYSELMKMQERPLILICPGGGYNHLSVREGETMAFQFMSMGYHAAVLHYSIAPNYYPSPLFDIAAAIKYLKDNSKKYHIIPDKIIVCGFSAGSHLVGLIGTGYNDSFLLKEFNVEADYLKPAGMILSYPVISSGKFAHRGSFENLLGPRANDQDMLTRLSVENCVDDQTVPTFLWHTVTDGTVPLENSLLMAQALRKHNVPFEFHVFPTGGHGLGLANELTLTKDYQWENDEGAAQWIDLCKNWLKRLFA